MAEPSTEKNGTGEAAEQILERGKRLSQSMLWPLQRGFYQKQGIGAWSTGTVPWFITNNAFIGACYARIVHAFMHDCATAGDRPPEPLDESQPIHIIEMGSGSGRFAFMVLRKLAALHAAHPPKGLRYRYVMTDVAASNLQFWQEHDAFKPFLEAGTLDFAQFNAETDDQLTLARSGEVISAATLRNPIVVIANYVFDTLAHDAFHIRDGVLSESLLTLVSSQPEPDLADPGMIPRLTARYEHAPVASDYYPDPEWNRILRTYQERLDGTSVCFPAGPLSCIANLARVSRGSMLLLSADKGYNHEEELLQRDDPRLVVHGSFSLSVNYHAIGLYVANRGGSALHSSAREASLCASAFILGGPTPTCPATRLAFAEHMEGFGPMDFFLLQESLRHDPSAPRPSLGYLLAVLRLSDWDPWLFYHLSAWIIDDVTTASAALKRDIRRALFRVWENHYPIGEGRDVLFEIGRIFWRMSAYQDALLFYRRSMSLFGEHYITLYNMGLCHHMLNQFPEATRLFDRALELNGTYGPARAWRIRAQAELESPPPAA